MGAGDGSGEDVAVVARAMPAAYGWIKREPRRRGLTPGTTSGAAGRQAVNPEKAPRPAVIIMPHQPLRGRGNCVS